MITNVSATGCANRVQESDEISSNPYNPVGQNTKESMFDRFAKKLADHLALYLHLPP